VSALKNYASDTFRLKNSRFSLSPILKIATILCWLIWAISYSKVASINIPTFHLDGAFQTASGLYRLDAGQLPGKDFYPYLGIGPLFLLYPFFKILGSSIAASVFSAQLVVLFVGVLSTTLIWHLIWRPKTFIESLIAGNILFLAPIGVANYFSIPIPSWMVFNISPGNSLRPLRAVAPYLVILFYYFFILHRNTVKNKYILSGLLTGSILLWSNDFAIPSAGLFITLIFIRAFHCKEFQANNLITYLLVFILSWVILLILTTYNHPIELLKYNFLDVAHDQWWYFGPYDESSRIFNLKQIPKLFSQENYLPLFILVLTAILALRTKLLEHALLLWIGAVLFTGGSVASIGGHLGGYFGSFYFWGMMLLCVSFLRLIWMGFKKVFASYSQITIPSTPFLLVISILLMVTSLNNLESELYNTKNDSNKFFIPELGGYLDNAWKDYINLARNSKAANTFEEYWGLWSATRKTFSNWPVDSVIHALGNTRSIAEKNLQSADTIISTRYSTSPMWQPWNLSQNYWFYENLLRDWTPYYTLSPTTVVWHKSENKRQFKDINCIFNNNESPSLLLQAQDSGFYEIEMQYNFSGNSRSLIMVRNNISFGGDVGGYISINPNATNVKFPVYIEKEGSTLLDTKILGQTQYSGYNFNIKSCIAKYIIPFKDGNEILTTPWWASIDNSFFVTDDNWVHGIARNWTGFFVPNAEKYSNEYKVGRLVRFSNGDSRLITQITSSGFYLRVYLDGELLNPEKIGWPTEFSVTDN
jgi:hypothetical protein